MKEELYDVVIYEVATREVCTMVGRDMNRDTGFYNAEKRREIALARFNDHYSAAIVTAGKYQKGDIISDQEAKA